MIECNEVLKQVPTVMKNNNYIFKYNEIDLFKLF